MSARQARQPLTTAARRADLTVHALRQAAYPTHGATLAIAISIGYDTAPPPTPKPPVAPGYSPCWSGSFCP